MPIRLRVIPSSDRGADGERSPTAERTIEFGDDVAEIRIGRRPDLELPLPFKALSALHARLVRKRKSRYGNGEASERPERPIDTWVIEDLGSKNGTFIDNDRLERGTQRAVTAGTQIALAHVNIVFDGPSSRIVIGAEGTGTIARRLVSDLFLAAPETNAPTLKVVEGPSTGSVLKLVERDKQFTVGRSKTCALRIKVHELSRQHAAFTRSERGVVVRDLGSKNGVQVNGVTVTEANLSDGDVIQMGPVTLRLADPEDRYMRDIEAQEENRKSRPPAAAPVGMAPAPIVPARVAPAPVAPAPDALHPMAGPQSVVSRSRFAPRPLAPAASAAIDQELHPAIAAALAAERVHEQIVDERSRSVLHGPRGATFIAAAVLAGILAAVIVLVLGD